MGPPGSLTIYFVSVSLSSFPFLSLLVTAAVVRFTASLACLSVLVLSSCCPQRGLQMCQCPEL